MKFVEPRYLKEKKFHEREREESRLCGISMVFKQVRYKK